MWPLQDQLDAGNVNGSFAAWASKHAPMYDGMDVPGPGGQPSLRGARLTAAQLPVPFCQLRSNRSGFISHNCTTADIAAQVKYWKQLHAAWQTRGWADLLFQYTIDEPGCFAPSAQHVAWDVIKESVGWLKQAHKSLRSLVTVDMGHATMGGVVKDIDIWVPLINGLWPKAINNGTRVCHPQSVGQAGVPPNLSNGTRDLRPEYDGVPFVWTSQSCMSYGGGPNASCADLMKRSNGACSVHWPSYAIVREQPPLSPLRHHQPSFAQAANHQRIVAGRITRTSRQLVCPTA